MYQYGQYCPVAKAVEILGDRWTLLIVRDLLTGTCRFNDLARGLPGISRSLLANRLRRLEFMDVVEKIRLPQGRSNTAYYLTDAGRELEQIIGALLGWGTRWAFAEPAESDLDPLLLMWWMRNRVCVEALPHERVVIRFDFTGVKMESYWLLLSREDVSICQSDPGFDLNVLVTADLAAFFQLWAGRLSWEFVRAEGLVEVDAIPSLETAFPTWFSYSLAAPAVRAVLAEKAAKGG